MQFDIQVGPRGISGDGSGLLTPWGGREGEMVVGNAHPLYAEAARRGRLYAASTAVAGVAPGTALSTTPPYALWNPLNSGKDLVLLTARLGYVSGTLGAGFLALAQVLTQGATVPTGGTELVPLCTKLNGSRGVGRVFQSSTVAATPAIVCPVMIIGTNNTYALQVPFDGEIVIPPGAVAIFQEVGAAGTSPLVVLALTWEEVTRASGDV